MLLKWLFSDCQSLCGGWQFGTHDFWHMIWAWSEIETIWKGMENKLRLNFNIITREIKQGNFHNYPWWDPPIGGGSNTYVVTQLQSKADRPHPWENLLISQITNTHTTRESVHKHMDGHNQTHYRPAPLNYTVDRYLANWWSHTLR